MSEELTKAKEVARARRQIRLLLREQHLSGYIEAVRAFAWSDDQTGEDYVGPEFDRKELREVEEEAIDEVRDERKKMLEDPESGPNVAEAARILLTAIGVYGIENGVAVAALEIVKNEILSTSRESAKIAAIHESIRAAFLAEAPEIEH